MINFLYIQFIGDRIFSPPWADNDRAFPPLSPIFLPTFENQSPSRESPSVPAPFSSLHPEMIVSSVLDEERLNEPVKATNRSDESLFMRFWSPHNQENEKTDQSLSLQ